MTLHHADELAGLRWAQFAREAAERGDEELADRLRERMDKAFDRAEYMLTRQEREA